MLFGLKDRRRRILFFLECAASLLIISDRYIWIYEGDLSTVGWWMSRINAFICFEMTMAIFVAFNQYLRFLFAQEGLDSDLKRFRFNNVLLTIGGILIVVFHFTGLYYYYDENGIYHNGDLLQLFSVITFVSMAVQISLIVQYYKKLSKTLRLFLLFFAIVPILDPILQALFPGFDTTNMALTFMAILLFTFDLIDTNKKAEMSLRAMKENKAKSAFLSNMSHEIRTPLNAVLGMNEMVLRESDDPKILQYSENIKSAGNTLLGLINDILDFSKIEAGKIEILPVDYDLSSAINDLMIMIGPRADMKGIALVIDIDKDTPKFLNGDEIRVKQVITNILTNAVKYTETGSVTFRLGFEWLDEKQAVNLIVSVKDTGIGIKEEDLANLFSKFDRLEQERNRNIEGTGLGMNITRSLLEMMGSTIEVESVYGEGSTFSFKLRQKVVDPTPIGDYAAVFQERARRHKKYTEKLYAPDALVLVVDDNALNLEVFRNLIRLTHIQSDMAESGEKCLELSMEKKYDLILLDHMMPGMDGIKTLHRLKSMVGNPNTFTPVICLTANAISGAREQYISEGFDDYLTKPIDHEKLGEILIRYLPEEKVTYHLSEETKAEADTEEEEAPEPEELPREILALQGQDLIDVEAGVENCDTVEAFLMILQIFYESLDEKVQELKDLYVAGDLQNYTIKVHSLKSSLRTIGAGKTGEAAQLLENAGKAEDMEYITANQEAFFSDVMKIKELLQGVF